MRLWEYLGMQQSIFLSFLTMVFCLMWSSHVKCEEIFLTVPALDSKVAISLPQGHDPQKRYPVVFYYSGLGGQPDTTLIRFHTGPKDWIVVGMGYVNQGQTDLSDAAMAREMKVFHEVKKIVLAKYGGNVRQCYAAGFSKGGWLTDAMLQTESSLAGGIILGAGKMRQFNPRAMYPRGKDKARKEIFIGIGRNDGNYTYAYHSLLMHRKMGAAVTLELWRDLGHSIPETGSPGLEQWLRLRLNRVEGLKELAQEKTQAAFGASNKLPPLAEYFALRDLSMTPYVKLLGDVWKKRISTRITELKKDAKVKNESLAYFKKQKALFLELKYRNSADLGKVRREYLAIKERFSDTNEATSINKDIDRVERLLILVSKREAEMKPKKREVRKKKEELERNDRKRIPTNPLIR